MGFSTIFPPMVRGQTAEAKLQVKLPFLRKLPAVIYSFVVKLLAEPHTMIKTLTERTGRPQVSYSIPNYSSMKILHSTKIRILWCSWQSHLHESLRFNPISHFHRFNSQSDLVFQPVRKPIRKPGYTLRLPSHILLDPYVC